MTDLAFVTEYDDDLDLAPEVLCSLLRRRSLRASDGLQDLEEETARRRARADELHFAWL